MTGIRGSTKLLAVLGDPVGHSLSPVLQNAAIRKLGLDWRYMALPVSAAALPVALEGLHALGAVGLNVTIPHKQAVMPLLQAVTPLAQRLGAVNTLLRQPHGWTGDNTDMVGFMAPLQRQGVDLRNTTALVLGGGGSARAVVAGCSALGCGRILVAGRHSQRLERFLADARRLADHPEGVPWPGLDAVLASVELVVNTTPVGMSPAANACPLTPPQLDRLRPHTWVYDIIYTPRPTTLLRQARARGCATVDGLAMLVGQGAAALRRWSGRPEVDEDAMRTAASAAQTAPPQFPTEPRDAPA
ncbi:MAG TPA: shikimate dehydrogenase [Synechococcus sp. UBA8638]|nr:shikimate dehydrogenase [Synechococcus sp. UBA8638]